MKQFLNYRSMIQKAQPSWQYAKEAGLIDLAVSYGEEPYHLFNDHKFINMCSCSYLGLDTHPDILEGAIAGVKQAKSLHLTTARVRIYTTLLQEVEQALSDHYRAHAMSYISCAAASSAYLPLLASGTLTGDCVPTMIFDKQAHFSMLHVKAICGDQTEVLTSPHNDLNFIEDQCKQNKLVAYVTDGTYSVSGHAPVDDLLQLQDRYGLICYFDDSHGLSITGEHGVGYVRSKIDQLNEKTIIVGSLAKAFGACGGVLLSGSDKIFDKLLRYGNSWSQYLNSAGLGAILASLKLHQSSILTERQQAWWENIKRFDKQFETQNYGLVSPIRIALLKTPEKAVQYAKQVFDKGYYISSVFFPIVPQGKAGLRIMPRANVSAEQMQLFFDTLLSVCGDDLVVKA